LSFSLMLKLGLKLLLIFLDESIKFLDLLGKLIILMIKLIDNELFLSIDFNDWLLVLHFDVMVIGRLYLV
jgi:hypothetical protein